MVRAESLKWDSSTREKARREGGCGGEGDRIHMTKRVQLWLSRRMTFRVLLGSRGRVADRVVVESGTQSHVGSARTAPDTCRITELALYFPGLVVAAIEQTGMRQSRGCAVLAKDWGLDAHRPTGMGQPTLWPRAVPQGSSPPVGLSFRQCAPYYHKVRTLEPTRFLYALHCTTPRPFTFLILLARPAPGMNTLLGLIYSVILCVQ